MRLSKHFTLAEFTKSQTAERKGIDNVPDDQQIYNMKMLCNNILEKVREHFEKPIIITSGFRSQELCLAIGSSRNSQHAKGEAADFEIAGVSNKELADFINQHVVAFDQLILEFHNEADPNSGWVHCSHRAGDNRQQYLIAYRDDMGSVKYKQAISS